MAIIRKKSFKVAIIFFVSVVWFLRSIYQKTANYPRFTMRYRPERIRAAFGPYCRKTDFLAPPRWPKSPATFYPIFLSEALFFICAGPLAKVSLFGDILPTHRHLTRIAQILGVGHIWEFLCEKLLLAWKMADFPNLQIVKKIFETPNTEAETFIPFW